jgi:predicted NACHT family NTPase
MTNQIYNWKRFWCPWENSINLSDGGYLYDPESDIGHIYNPHVIPFESIAMVPCLILLGEPGIGKTYAMRAEKEAIDIRVEEGGGKTLWMDLRAYGSEDRLIHNLFESTEFVSWVNDKHQLHLFLDNLDECLLRINTLSALLAEELKKYPIERLYLRIACRIAEWPRSLETKLGQLWDGNTLKVYKLAYLRKIDVIEAARINGLTPEAFLNEIDEKEVVPLAIKPVTLDFLIRTYSRQGQLPSTQAELYFQGCRLLCEEISDTRRDAGFTGNFTSEQRVAVASRIAATIVFANKYAVWTNLDRGDVPDEDITVQELCGGNEGSGNEQFQVGEIAIRETLTTGLFSSRGPNCMSWAHQTYAEFLAARYLVQHEMTLTQMMSLIIHAGDSEEKIVPQLHETAAWLARMVPSVFQEIMRVDPKVLLRSAITTANVKDRAALVEALLKSFDEERLLDLDQDILSYCQKLAHPGLAEQLRPYLCDNTKGIVVRRAAINIAEACDLQTLQSDLVSIALDPCQLSEIRVNAAYAVYLIGDDKAKANLKPLVTDGVGDDPDDELKGCGLLAVWPAHMTAEEVFAVLTLPKRPTFGGAYLQFLLLKLLQNLNLSDLPIALKWVKNQGSVDNLPYIFEELIHEIMLQAWEHLELPGVLEGFAAALPMYLRHCRSITSMRNLLSDDDNKRRQVLEKILPLLSDHKEDLFCLKYSIAPLILGTDMQWMIERFSNEKSIEIQALWAQLIEEAFDWREPVHFDAIFSASQDNPVFADAFAWLLKPVELNSSEAQKMRDNYLKRQEVLKRDTDNPPLEPPPMERISRLLDECETGDIATWWRLNMDMTLEPDSTHYGDDGESDLTFLPGWKTADTGIRARIVEVAKRYIQEQDPETHRWLGADTLYRPALAGYRALRLFLQEDPDFLSIITPDVWKKWAPIILAFLPSRNAEEKSQCELVKLAYKHAPDEIIRTMMVIIDEENEKSGSISVNRKVESCWDDRLADALLNKAKDETLKPKCMGCLLADLLDHRNNEAKIFAESLVHLPLLSSNEGRSRAIVAACGLMTRAEDAGWSVVWPAISEDVDFGREIISAVAQQDIMDAMSRRSPNDTSIGQRLTVNQLADLYVWLVQQYPPHHDPRIEGALGVGPREYIADWRDSILRHLILRGTSEACEAIKHIAQELPELDWLKWTLMKAQDITRRRNWKPLQPEDIIEVANNPQVRSVQNGHQLLDVLIESLRRLEEKLQGETPAAQFLWDRINNNLYKPKDENSFSDYVKIHLDEDLRKRGIIVNREVQIHRGQRTDIHVDAVIRDSNNDVYDSVTVIIEVKGCWNTELNSAMKTQLVDRYLENNRCRYGLYLVGWFNCDQWDNNDYRKNQAPKVDKNESQERFNAQALELSRQGIEIKTLVINTAL